MSRGRKKYIAPAIPQVRTVKKPEYRTLDVYSGGRSIEELKEIRRVLAKQANQRIVRLEREKSTITGEAFNTYGAITDVYEYLDHRDRHRFSESLNVKLSDSELKHEITVLQGFLGRKSSTVKGMKEIERKRVKTFESSGIHFSDTKEFYDFLNSQTFHNLVVSGFTSEQIVEAYDQMRENESHEKVFDRFMKALEEFRSGEVKVTIKNLEKALNVKIIAGR